MLRSLYSAVSGIGVNQKSMDVIGNNIANVNTIGFKQGRAVFQDMLSQTLNSGKAPTDSRGGINPRQVGTGAYLVAVDNIFEQGTIKTTSRVHDVAIEGNGFFVVRGEGQTNYYTRAGDFNFDKTGYLTTPSGYRVQGWMADATTGSINYNTSVDDIYVTKDHQIMPAKATTEVSYAGVLGTAATRSQYDFPKMYTQANRNMNVWDALSSQAAPLGLTSTDTVRVKAHATGLTDMGKLFNSNGQSMALSSNVSTVTFNVDGGAPITLTYSSTYIASGSGTFNTVGEFINELNAELATYSASATVEDGRIRLQYSGTSTFKLSSISSQNSYLTSLLGGLDGTYSSGGAPKRSAEMYYHADLKATEDFSTFDELTTSINNAINGHVTTTGHFNATFLESDWGLEDGETLSIVYSAGGTTVTATFTYVEDPNNAAPPASFNSLFQLIDCFNSIGTDLTFTATDDGGMALYTNVSATITQIFTETSVPTRGASPYLENLLSTYVKSFNPNELVNIEDVSGKGKICYNVTTAAVTHQLTGFSIMKSTTGDTFDKNILETQGIDVTSGQAVTSLRFLTTADENTNMRDIFGEGGQYCMFIENDSYIDFTAVVGDTTYSSGNRFTVQIDTRVEDMMLFIEEYLGLGSNYNSKSEVTMSGGVITLNGAKGAANDISSFSLRAFQPNGQLTFTNAFIAQKKAEATGGQFVTDMPIYDEQGNRHLVRFEFSMFNETKNEWTMKISTDDPDVSVYLNGATTNELVMRFNSDGTPSYLYDRHAVPVRVIANPTFDLVPGNGANTVSNIAINLGTTGTRDGLTLSNAATTINTNEQDGYPLGVLEQLLFNNAGEIIGYYTNNQVRTVGKLALATFQNNQGLQKIGDTMFAETSNSGMAAIGEAQSGSRGSIAASALEQSNVDLSNEFVSMIVTQRGFQANSRVVTTSDEMIQELLNLKR